MKCERSTPLRVDHDSLIYGLETEQAESKQPRTSSPILSTERENAPTICKDSINPLVRRLVDDFHKHILERTVVRFENDQTFEPAYCIHS